MPTYPVTIDQVRRYRMQRSGLLAPYASPEAAAGALFGVQAQILPAAGIALWNRTTGLTHDRFEELLFTQRTLVKLWGQRGTLHLYPSAEWPLVYSAIAAGKTWWGASAEKEERYTDYNALVEQVAVILRQRDTMGRTDLRSLGLALDDDHLSPWGGIFADLVRRGYACHCGRSENEGMFAAREFWLPELTWNPPAAEAANLEALRRYLHVFGPSTVKDFAYWRGAKITNAHRWWGMLQDGLVEVDVDGAAQTMLRDDVDDLLAAPADAPWPLHMLYRFDPLLLAHKDKQWIVPATHYSQVWRPAGHIEGIVLVGGQAAATWRYDRKGSGLIITVQPFRKLTKTVQKQIGRTAVQIAGFFGTPLTDLRWHPIFESNESP